MVLAEEMVRGFRLYCHRRRGSVQELLGAAAICRQSLWSLIARHQSHDCPGLTGRSPKLIPIKACTPVRELLRRLERPASTWRVAHRERRW